MVDALETADAFGLKINPALDDTGQLTAEILFDAYQSPYFHRISEAWIPVVFAINNLGRSIGKGDLYSFILSASVIKKMEFVHSLTKNALRLVRQVCCNAL
jgi:hypothetical protein